MIPKLVVLLVSDTILILSYLETLLFLDMNEEYRRLQDVTEILNNSKNIIS